MSKSTDSLREEIIEAYKICVDPSTNEIDLKFKVDIESILQKYPQEGPEDIINLTTIQETMQEVIYGPEIVPPEPILEAGKNMGLTYKIVFHNLSPLLVQRYPHWNAISGTHISKMTHHIVALRELYNDPKYFRYFLHEFGHLVVCEKVDPIVTKHVCLPSTSENGNELLQISREQAEIWADDEMYNFDKKAMEVTLENSIKELFEMLMYNNTQSVFQSPRIVMRLAIIIAQINNRYDFYKTNKNLAAKCKLLLDLIKQKLNSGQIKFLGQSIEFFKSYPFRSGDANADLIIYKEKMNEFVEKLFPDYSVKFSFVGTGTPNLPRVWKVEE